MKKINRTWGKIFIPLLLILASTTVIAQSTISEVTSYMKILGWTKGDARYANLKEDGNTSWWYRNFHYGYEYKIIAFSEDEDVIDMELEVQYADGRAFDYNIDEWASVYVTPLSDVVSMRIRMQNFSSLTPYYASRCNFVVYYKKR